MSLSKVSIPTLGIVIPVYNGEKFITLALDSVLSLDSKPDEFLVFDNKSTDKTPELLQKYKDKHGINVVTSPIHFTKMAESWNHAVSQLSTDWYHLMSADDLLRSNFVERFRGHLAGKQAAISMLSEEVDEHGKVRLAKFSTGKKYLIEGRQLVEANLHSSVINVASVLIRKHAWLEAGGYPTEFSYIHDMVFFQRLAGLGGVLKVHEVVARYRVDSQPEKMGSRKAAIDFDRRLYETSVIPQMVSEWGLTTNEARTRMSKIKDRVRRLTVVQLSFIKLFLYKLHLAVW